MVFISRHAIIYFIATHSYSIMEMGKKHSIHYHCIDTIIDGMCFWNILH